MSGDQTASPNPSMDPNLPRQIVFNPDGTMTRLLKDRETPPTSDPSLRIPVLLKDIPINQSNNTWVRLFLPSEAL
jgi:hypothetical protein